MHIEEINAHLDGLEKILNNVAQGLKDEHDLEHKKRQFRAVDNSIRQLSEGGIPIPPELNQMRETLQAEIERFSVPLEEVEDAYRRALELVVKLGRLCRHNPRKDLSLMAKEKRQRETKVAELGKILVSVLQKMGGSGREKSVVRKVEEALQGQFTEADLDCPQGKTPRWLSNLRRARNKLIEQGVLTPNSKGRRWALADQRVIE
ncbi:MAG: hypothetical protein JRI79_07600 [Deltaproteobacteria bacterium]|nr:hypothetical protein [Deltaproteobacteria bacterium]MBW2301066.1 hypothetical protein [Deltaproteobacteria bacterium]